MISPLFPAVLKRPGGGERGREKQGGGAIAEKNGAAKRGNKGNEKNETGGCSNYEMLEFQSRKMCFLLLFFLFVLGRGATDVTLAKAAFHVPQKPKRQINIKPKGRFPPKKRRGPQENPPKRKKISNNE